MRETKAKTWKPDETFYKELIAKAILFKDAAHVVKDLPDLRAQIIGYVVSALAFRTGGRFDLLHVWQEQRMSAPLESLIQGLG